MAEERARVTITELAPGGAGIAHVERDGERRAVFVARAAPGDVADVAIDFATRPARAAIVSLVSAGAGRAAPPCAHAAACGGCDWMHLSTEAQAEAHVAVVRAALPDEWRDAPLTHNPAPSRLRFRTRARVHVVASGRSISVGMFSTRSHEPVTPAECVILDPVLDSARLALRAMLGEARAKGRGEAKLALGHPSPPGGAPRRAVLDLAWEGELPAPFFGALERGSGAGGPFAGARVRLPGAKRSLDVGDPTPWIVAADGEPLALAPGGFAQSSDLANAGLVRRVAALALPSTVPAGSALLELYAGAGNLTVMLARGAKVTAWESDEAAADAARANLRARRLAGRVTCRDARGAEIPDGTRVVVLDPPRAGAREVCEALVRRPPARVVYVSCDPQTLGRDARVLAARFAPSSIDVFEMFPHTSHVETVLALDRRPRRP